MHTNNTNGEPNKLIYPDLSYIITGVCFNIHNELGRYSREKQYGDALEYRLKEIKIPYKREFKIEKTGNIVDFILDDKIILELKVKDFVIKEDYYQTQRYLQATELKLALLINFRSRYLKPIRIVKIDTDIKNRFI